MYSDADIEAAVAAGALTPDAAASFRDYVAGSRATPLVDEEHFRLISGFNDIFVTIASILLLVAVAWIAGAAVPAFAGAAVAATSWGLAEYFTRQRRMALPSILLLGTFVGGVFFTGLLWWKGVTTLFDTGDALPFALASAASAAGAAVHWWRFKVPITVAAGAGGVVGLVLALLLAIVPGAWDWLAAIMFLTGLGVFAFAMWWDMSDPGRTTRRSDVAFWLHLLAAPLIVHPIFALLGLLDAGATMSEGVAAVLLYVALGVVALAVDRRALMVSALVYVLYAISALFRQFGAVSLSFALTALVIGSALLLLSAFWHSARGVIVRALPEPIQRRLPLLDRRVTPQPA